MKKIDKKLNSLIPGGAHTYSRGYDQFSHNTPGILKRGKGCYVYDNLNNKYLDYGMGLRSIILGYADSKVNKAAIQQIYNGNTLTRPSNIEMKVALKLKKYFSYIDMVKFAKNSSNAVTGATKLARAYNGRKIILRCLDHPFFSFDDWFIGSTDVNRGIPKEISKLTKTFNYNDLKSFKKQLKKYKNKISCVVMEASTFSHPKRNFLKQVKYLCKKNKIVFIIDETITGFRWHFKGACYKYKIKPDLVIFGKAIANGFSLAVLAGNKKIMNLGSIDKKKHERVFLLSSTHGAEMSSLGAASKTIDLLSDGKKIKKIWDHGAKLIKNINKLSNKFGLEKNIFLYGMPCSPYMATNINSKNSFKLKTLLQEELIKHKVIMPWISISASHTDKEANYLIRVFKKILPKIKKVIDKDINKYKFKNIIKPVFRKYN
tara:strand:+ start:78 stop:1370 length:1293 start_codon:yes stop_codon:yes gene_type:complete